MSVWEKVDSQTLEMLKEQKAFEDETVKRLTPFYDSIQNPLAKLFIRRIILDTMKHSVTYQTLIDLDKRALVGDIVRETMAEKLKTHIIEEGKMLNQAEKISESIKDEKFKKILESIVEDERKHHKVLQEMFEIIMREAEDWDRYFYEITTAFP